jgi:hypothetical protein
MLLRCCCGAVCCEASVFTAVEQSIVYTNNIHSTLNTLYTIFFYCDFFFYRVTDHKAYLLR